MSNAFTMRDPTAEAASAQRERLKPPQSIEGLTIGLLDIGKTRSDEFLASVGKLLSDRGYTVRHYAKPTNAKPAPIEVVQSIAAECDLVVEALAD
jgi:hypothetical protein